MAQPLGPDYGPINNWYDAGFALELCGKKIERLEQRLEEARGRNDFALILRLKQAIAQLSAKLAWGEAQQDLTEGRDNIIAEP